MKLLKKNVSYNWTEDGDTEYGDLYSVSPKDMLESCIDHGRCYHCGNEPGKSPVIFKCSDSDDMYFICHSCAEKLFDLETNKKSRGIVGKLIELGKTKELCEIYTDDFDESSFYLGKIIAADNDTYIFLSIDTKADPDGIRFGFTKYVRGISHNSRHIDKYKAAIEMYGKNCGTEKYSAYFDNSHCGLSDFLEFARKNGKVVSFMMCGSEKYNITGLIEEYDDETVAVNELDEFGRDKAVTIIGIGDIDFASCDSWDEKFLKDIGEHMGEKI